MKAVAVPAVHDRAVVVQVLLGTHTLYDGSRRHRITPWIRSE